jgi:hypothetical protein
LGLGLRRRSLPRPTLGLGPRLGLERWSPPCPTPGLGLNLDLGRRSPPRPTPGLGLGPDHRRNRVLTQPRPQPQEESPPRPTLGSDRPRHRGYIIALPIASSGYCKKYTRGLAVTSPSGILRSPSGILHDAYLSLKLRSYCKKYTRGLAVTTQHLEPSLETPSDKVCTGRPRWLTPLGLYAPAKGVNSTQGRRTCPLRPCKQHPSPGRLLCGVWTSSVPCKRNPGASRTCWSPSTNSPSGSRSDP